MLRLLLPSGLGASEKPITDQHKLNMNTTNDNEDQSQPKLPLTEEQSTEAAIKQVEENNSPSPFDEALHDARILLATSLPSMREVTSDTVFPDLKRYGFTDNRVVGAMMKRLAGEGSIAATTLRMRKSGRPGNHQAPRRIYDNNLHRGQSSLTSLLALHQDDEWEFILRRDIKLSPDNRCPVCGQVDAIQKTSSKTKEGSFRDGDHITCGGCGHEGSVELWYGWESFKWEDLPI